MANGGGTYEQATDVVSPAFNELIIRMRRARMIERARDGEADSALSTDEKRIFEYGVEARKRVIESTLTIVFGQWAVHRAVVRHRARALRTLYTAGCVGGALMFISIRARSVSHEMFARIVTLPTTSPMANEARVILAELEGPDGPYYRGICRGKNFAEDLYAVVATLPDTDAHLHPQLRLKPRLEQPRRPRGLGDAAEDDDEDKQFVVGRATRVSSRETLPGTRRNHTLERMRKDAANDGDVAGRGWTSPDEYNHAEWQGDKDDEVKYRSAALRKSEGEEDVWHKDDAFEAKPFDFAQAAAAWDDESTSEEDAAHLTPSQRRAQLRRERRRKAREERRTW